MDRINHRINALSVMAVGLMAGMACGEDSYSPYAGDGYPANVYFGDTHVHTTLSNDATGQGNLTLSPDAAYRFAKGEAVISNGGRKARLREPLDFLVVADHAKNLGVFQAVLSENDLLRRDKHYVVARQLMQKYPRSVHQVLNGERMAAYAQREKVNKGFWKEALKLGLFSTMVGDTDFRQSMWAEVGANAERHNQPGLFTAFIGYEWTSTGTGKLGSGNLHRVLVYKDRPERTSQMLPYTNLDSMDPEDLWDYMAQNRRGSACHSSQWQPQFGGDVRNHNVARQSL